MIGNAENSLFPSPSSLWPSPPSISDLGVQSPFDRATGEGRAKEAEGGARENSVSDNSPPSSTLPKSDCRTDAFLLFQVGRHRMPPPRQQGRTLLLRSVARGDRGVYQCVAEMPETFAREAAAAWYYQTPPSPSQSLLPDPSSSLGRSTVCSVRGRRAQATAMLELGGE